MNKNQNNTKLEIDYQAMISFLGVAGLFVLVGRLLGWW